MEQLRESVHNRRLRSRSVDIDCGRTEAKSDGQMLTLNGTITPCEPTHWAFGQLAAMVKAPAAYLRTLPQPLLVDCLNHGLKEERETVKFMTVETDSETNILQAVTSTTYGRIWDAEVVDAVARIQERTGNRFYNPKAYAHQGKPDGFRTIDTSRTEPAGLYASDRDVFMFMIDGGSLLDAGPRAQLNRGFMAWNSETGAKSMGLMTFLFNTVCGNNIIWGATDVNKLIIRHTAGGPTRFDLEAAPTLLAYANGAAAPVEAQLRKAQEMVLWDGKDSSFDGLMGTLDRVAKFSKPEVRNAIAFAKSEEGDCRTVWQLVQGFTAYARGFDWIDSRTNLEARAGKLLTLANN